MTNAAELAPQTAADFFRHIRGIKHATDGAMEDARQAIEKAAQSKRAAKQARATATLALSGEKLTVAEREAHVIQAVADLEYEADLAADMKKLRFERIEALRQEMSAAQSYASLSKVEAQLLKYEPSEVASA